MGVILVRVDAVLREQASDGTGLVLALVSMIPQDVDSERGVGKA